MDLKSEKQPVRLSQLDFFSLEFGVCVCVCVCVCVGVCVYACMPEYVCEYVSESTCM